MDFAVPGTVEFAEENTLPGTQHQASSFENKGLGTTDQGRFAVGRGIPLGVTECHLLEFKVPEAENDIIPDVRVRVLINGYGGRGMGSVDETYALVDAFVTHGLLYAGSNINEFFFRS
jgi:hypothetical protein